MPTAVFHQAMREGFMAVMIGVDPHKGSHTAVAIDDGERPLGEVKVRASAGQVERLLDWAASFGERTWAVEGAGGLGYLLAQQLVAAGEHVVDVPPKLAARVRLLASGKSNKNDPNDARSVAVAALRSRTLKDVRGDDHVAVMRVWAKRNNDLGRARNKTACRLHSVLCELVPGGIAGEISAGHAADRLDRFEPADAIESARRDLALELIDDLRRLDDQMRESKKRIAQAVAASGTILTELFGVGPVVAAMVIGYTGDVARFTTRDRYASYTGTAPIEVSSGPRKVHRVSRRGNRQLNHAIHIAAVTQIRFRHTEGRAFFDRKVAEGKTPKEALRALKRRISDALYRQLQLDAQRASAAQQRAREGKRGTTPRPARPALTLNTGSSAKPLPDPTSPYDTPRRHDHRPVKRIPTSARRRT
jgi:transposase